MATPEEKTSDPHADCPPAVWNGIAYECRNHHPAIVIPTLRQPTKQLPPPPEGGARRPAQAPMGMQQALAATTREQKALRDDKNVLSERIDALEAFAEGLVEKIRVRFETVEESITGLEDSIGASQIMDNVVHVQKLYGRCLAIEEVLKAAGAWSDDEPPTVHAPPTEPPKTEPPKAKK